MGQPISDAAIDTIFRNARTYRRSADAWLDKPVDDAQLRAVFDLAKLGPTSANSSPARFVIVRSRAAKEKLKTALSPDNAPQTMAAPATVIVACRPDVLRRTAASVQGRRQRDHLVQGET